MQAGLLAAEKAIASTAAVAKLLPYPHLITRSLDATIRIRGRIGPMLGFTLFKISAITIAASS